MHPQEVGHAKPGLVNVDQVLVALVQLQERYLPSLPQHQAPLGVFQDRYVLHLPVAYSHLSELHPDLLWLHYQMVPALDLSHHLLYVLDVGVLVQQLLDI